MLEYSFDVEQQADSSCVLLALDAYLLLEWTLALEN